MSNFDSWLRITWNIVEVCAPKIDDLSLIPVYHEFSYLSYLQMDDTAWQFVT